jgi:uncharacterized protein YdeI (YjbR/CyaY-like superfamily)
MRTEIKWQEEIGMLKSIIRKAGLGETIKWGAEVYTHNGKNVVSCGGFKNYFTIWFYNGVFLKDEHKVLINAQEGKTKALRQWRFTSKDEIDENLILKYIYEAIKNEEEGKVWKPEKSKPVEIPELILNALNKEKKLKIAFQNLNAYKQKEYIEHINSAKREETKLSRLEKIKPMILAGIGINNKYKNG